MGRTIAFKQGFKANLNKILQPQPRLPGEQRMSPEADPSRRPPPLLRLADGGAVAYRQTAGAGPGVVFFGGYKSVMSGSKALALEAWCRAQGRACVCFDYTGHGASSGRFQDGTIGRWTEDALAVLDRLTEGPQILAGSSMGGWLMLKAALARPDRVAGLLGIASAADFTEDLLWPAMDQPTRARLQAEGIVYPPADEDGRVYPITWRFIEEGRSHLLLRDGSLRGEPLPIACPVRLVHGMADSDVPWQTSVRIAQRLAGQDVRVILIKDGGHRLSRPADLDLIIATLAELIGAAGG